MYISITNEDDALNVELDMNKVIPFFCSMSVIEFQTIDKQK